MKTKHVIYSLLVLLIIFTGCREITVTTKVNKNGSFTRIISIRGDSSDLYKSGLPYPIDSSWISHIKPDTSEANKFILTYSKTYANNDLLNAEIENDTSWKKQLNRKIEINKRFGLFYSYIRYREIYPAANPFTKLDYKNYLTNGDLQIFRGNFLALNKQDSLLLEKTEDKMDDYLLQSISIEIRDILKKGVLQVNNKNLDTSIVDFYKDSIDVKIDDWEYDNPQEFIRYMKEWTDNPAFEDLNKIDPPLFQEQNQKFLFIMQLIEMEDFTNVVEMPGLITSTNSINVKGNRLSWGVDVNSFLVSDYDMTAESRVINKWGFITTGIVILFTILIFFVKLRNRRNV
ncbi:MAG: hypothetical protein R2750_04770 [Bacteroidales bacterium]